SRSFVVAARVNLPVLGGTWGGTYPKYLPQRLIATNCLSLPRRPMQTSRRGAKTQRSTWTWWKQKAWAGGNVKRTKGATMRPIFICLAIGFLLAADDPADELKKLQGNWQLISVEENGIVNDKVPPTRLVIKDDGFTFYRGDKAGFMGSLKIDAKANPKAIEFLRPNDKGLQMSALYVLEGATLKRCYSDKEDRSKELKTSIRGIRIGTYKKQAEKK